MFKTPAKNREGRSTANSTRKAYPSSAGQPQPHLASVSTSAIQTTASAIRLVSKKNMVNSPIIPSLGLGVSGGFNAASIPLVQSEHYSISRLAAHPPISSQFYPYIDMDYASGFVSFGYPDHVSVWNARSAIVPTTKLPMPLYNQSQDSPCIACLVASATPSAPVGIVAVNRAGIVRAWGNVELPKLFCEAELPMDVPFNPIFLTRIQISTFLLGLDNGSVICILVEDFISCTTLKKTSLQRSLLSYFGTTSSALSDINLLNSLEDRLVSVLSASVYAPLDTFYLASGKCLQKWSLHHDYDSLSYHHQWHVDLATSIPMYLQQKQQGISFTSVLGAGYYKPKDYILCLVKAQFRGNGGDSSFYLVGLKENQSQSGVDIVSLRKLNFSSAKSSVLTSFIVTNSSIVLFSFPENMVMVSLSGVEFEECIPFKTADLMAASFDLLANAEYDQNLSCILYSSSTGVLELNMSILRFKPEMQQYDLSSISNYFSFRIHPGSVSPVASDVASKLEQIVFSSSDFENPISLKLQRNADDLNQPALDLSTAIVNGSHSRLPNVFDEISFLNETSQRCHGIILAIVNNGLLEKISETTRLKLMFNAEKMAVMYELWAYQNSMYLKKSGEELICFGLLEDSITNFIQKRKLGIDLKVFFRIGATLLSEYLFSLHTYLQELVNQQQGGRRHLLVLEGCRILNIVYKTAFTYRFENRDLYQYDYTCLKLEIWTASHDMLAILQRQFEISIKSIETVLSTTHQPNSNDLQIIESFKQSFYELCGYVLGSFRDAKLHFETVREKQRQIELLVERYRVLLDKANSSLIKFDMVDQAFLLAENFEEFEILVGLTLENQSKEYRIKSYIQRFGREFAMILYQSLIDKNEKKYLLGLDSVDSALLDEFLKKESLKDLLWIQDVKHKRFLQASENLWDLAQTERDIKKQSTALALSKLNYLATIRYEDLKSENAKTSIETFEKAQDLIEFHNILLNYIKDVIVGEDLLDDIDSILAAVMSKCFGSVSSHSVLYSLLKGSSNELFRERKISVVSILDLVTLLYPPSDELYIDVLKLLQNKIESSTFFFHLVWRRVWLSNDWKKLSNDALNKSDEEVMEMVNETTIKGLLEKIKTSEQGLTVIEPLDIKLVIPSDLALHYPNLSQHEFEGLKAELSREHEAFLNLSSDVDLRRFWL